MAPEGQPSPSTLDTAVVATRYQHLVGPPPMQLDRTPAAATPIPQLVHETTQGTDADAETDAASSGMSDSSSDEIDSPESLSVSDLQRSLREIDAESILAPVISHTQSKALYAAAASPAHSRRASTSSSLSGEITPTSGLKPIPEKENAQKQCAPAPNVPRYSSAVPGRKLTRSASQKKSQRKDFSFSLSALQLPSLPLVSLPSFVTGSSSSGSGTDKVKRRVRSLTLPKPSSGTFFSPRSATFFGGRQPEEAPAPANPSRPPTLRRASSVSSMPRAKPSLSRTVSATSSLGDDNKYHHIHSQTNSRFKAIKDNLLDTLPQLQLPNLSQQLANLNPFNDPSVQTTSTATLYPPKSPALEALDGITGDVVVMGGYRGSILRDRTANNRRVWIPLKVGFNLRKVDLEVGLEPEDEERMAEKIWADGMLTHIGPVDIGRRLIRRLRSGADEKDRRVHDWGYDWRLSPALLSRRLIAFLETLPCNKPWLGESPDVKRKGKGALVIAHSLGGLVVRHAMNLRPELFSGVLFAGTPQTCVNILGPLRNGDAVLFNSKVFTAQVSFTLRSSFAFLPEDGQCFIDRRTGKPIPLDFFDVKTWQEYALSPCVVPSSLRPPALKLTSPASVLYTLRERIDTNSISTPSYHESSDMTGSKDRTIAPQMSGSAANDQTVTLPLSRTVPYLERTLKETLEFKRELHYKPHMEKAYPPQAVIYSKTTPTCRGARVDGVEGIKKVDAYDDLAFGAGDGVCLARAAMLPPGYKCAKKVAVDRGHVSLLGDLEGVGKCLAALIAERGW